MLLMIEEGLVQSPNEEDRHKMPIESQCDLSNAEVDEGIHVNSTQWTQQSWVLFPDRDLLFIYTQTTINVLKNNIFSY